jgi:predicted transcriptional regulator
LEPKRKQPNLIAIASDCLKLSKILDRVLNDSESVFKLDGEGEMKTKSDRTFLISVRPRWASTFFLSHNPKSIELRKGNFGASLKPGDNLVIYSTLPQGKVIGTVKVVKREPLIIDRLWEQSQQGKLTYVTQSEFDTYYSNTICGVGIWVSEPRQWKHPLGLFELREILGKRWQPPQQMQRLTHEQMSAIGIAHQHKRALLCHR